jgi:hypothetical protein
MGYWEKMLDWLKDNPDVTKFSTEATDIEMRLQEEAHNRIFQPSGPVSSGSVLPLSTFSGPEFAAWRGQAPDPVLGIQENKGRLMMGVVGREEVARDSEHAEVFLSTASIFMHVKHECYIRVVRDGVRMYVEFMDKEQYDAWLAGEPL